MGSLLKHLAVTAGIFSIASSHMIMKTPAPFNKVMPDNSPLSSSGANFPCKNDDSVGFYETSKRTAMAIGETQTLSFTGSAVHGGGSCQLAVTSDKAPTASTSWQVILSIEGGCPSKSGDGPSTYDYQIPAGIAPGDATLAWTWISKLAGQPEYYMNCAPITITGGSKKRDAEELAKRATFPELFVANLASVNDCKVGPTVDVIFPNPGANVMYPKSASAMANGTATGTNCVPKGSTGQKSGDTTGTPTASILTISTAAAGTTATPAASYNYSTSSTPTPTKSGAQAQSSSPPASSQPSLISLTLPTPLCSRLNNSTSTKAPKSTPSGSGSGSTPATASTSAPTSTTASASASSTFSTSTKRPAPAPTASSTPSSSLAGKLSGPCTPEGQWNCLPASSGKGFAFQRCASGQWSVMMDLSAGQICQLGLSMNLWRRSSRIVR